MLTRDGCRVPLTSMVLVELLSSGVCGVWLGTEKRVNRCRNGAREMACVSVK